MTTTPRTNAAIIAANGRWTYELKEEMQAMERELNAAILNETIATNELHKAKERIAHLERELDIATTQVHELKHQSADAIEQELRAKERINELTAEKDHLQAELETGFGIIKEQQERIKRLEDIIRRARVRFCSDCSDEAAACGMLKILDEAKEAKP